MQRTLGTQLRHLIELLDGAVRRSYSEMGLTYRPRYTPIMRSLMARDPLSLGEVAQCAGITQPAASQTVALMIADGLIETAPSTDARQKLLRLSSEGRTIADELQKAWAYTAMAAESLDDELPTSFTGLLAAAIKALEATSFDERIRHAKAKNPALKDLK
jgi:MarR family transcriptional regulator, organic hydroperoxide resistance regulator